MFRLAFLGIDHPHGAGWRESLLQLPEGVQVTAVVPAFNGGTTSLEERLAEVPRFDSVDELLSHGEFDGAIVCLPNDEGPGAIVKLAEAGKHVLAEKPVAGSAADGRRVAEAVERAGVAFQTGYMWRYDDGANRLRGMLSEGRFGRLISIEMTMVTADVGRRGPGHYLFDPQKCGGQNGFFNWLACHYFDLLFYVVREPVVAVTARVGRFGAEDVSVDDGGTAILELAGGALVTFTGGYWVPRWSGESQWTLRGSQRWVHWHPTRPGTSGVLEIHGPQPQFQAMDETFSLPVDNSPGYGGRRSVALLTDWINAATSQPVPKCRSTPESMTQTLELLDVIYKSSAEGRRIECRIGM